MARPSNLKINFMLLDYAIQSNYKSRRAFAIEHKFKPHDVQNWSAGKSSPSDRQRKRLCQILNLSEQQLLLSSLSNMFNGLEFAITRWSEEHRSLQRESLSDSDAIKVLMSLTTVAEQEAIEDDSIEAPFFVQGPDEQLAIEAE